VITAEAIESSSFFDLTEFTPDTLERYADSAYASFAALERFSTQAKEYQQRAERGQGEPLKLALALLLLGRYGEALEWFERAPASKVRHFYAAQAALRLGQAQRALDELRLAARHGWDAVEVDARAALAHLRAGDLAAADKLLAKHDQDGRDRPAWYFAQGRLAAERGEREAALEAFEKALTLDPDHADAMFHSARLYDLWGADDQALELYHRLSLQPRAHVNALLNAAVIDEDAGRYDEAAACLRRVLRAYPNHTRARLFLKDIESCQQMVIQEAYEEHADARTQLLDMPLSEFELSVRARNCLKKMNIRTVGELIRLTETELLAYKNFGETSLNEIKALLARKNLRLGMNLDEIEVEPAEERAEPPPPVATAATPTGQEAILSRLVAELELSVRARRCLQRLNVVTLSDLVQYTEADLLATRNFGATSLSEVKARLAEHGLQLTPKRNE
jgi:DNA-directed RNA polymerase subunit alpha